MVRRDLDPVVVGRSIVAVEVGRDRAVRRDASIPAYVDALAGRRVARTDRVGKFLLVHLDGGGDGDGGRPDVVIVHLGMSGQLRTAATAAEPRLPHTHVVWTLEQGAEVRFVDPRTFGATWTDRTGPDGRPTSMAHLGPDALAAGGDPEVMGRALAGRRDRSPMSRLPPSPRRPARSSPPPSRRAAHRWPTPSTSTARAAPAPTRSSTPSTRRPARPARSAAGPSPASSSAAAPPPSAPTARPDALGRCGAPVGGSRTRSGDVAAFIGRPAAAPRVLASTALLTRNRIGAGTLATLRPSGSLRSLARTPVGPTTGSGPGRSLRSGPGRREGVAACS